MLYSMDTSKLIPKSMQQEQLQYLKKIIVQYTQDMAGIAKAFAVAYGVSSQTETSDYDFSWLEEWHYNYAQEQYDLQEMNLPFEDYDRPITYQNKLWNFHVHDPQWLFTSDNGIKIEVYYSDIRRIDTCFLLDYANSLENNILGSLKLNFNNTVALLDQLAQEQYLQKLPCHHSGFVYILQLT